MTTALPPATGQTSSTDLVWPVAVPADAAIRTVARRLPPGASLTARLYHHPFLGVSFLLDEAGPRSRRRGRGGGLLAAVAVDLVSGRAVLTDPWGPEDLTTRAAALAEAAAASHGDPAPVLRSPAPRVIDDEAMEAARALLPGLLARRRRLGSLAPARLAGRPVAFGKPNWWVSGRSGDRTVEVVVDGLSGRHYARFA